MLSEPLMFQFILVGSYHPTRQHHEKPSSTFSIISLWALEIHQVPLNPPVLSAESVPIPQLLLAGHTLHKPWGNSLPTASLKIRRWMKGKHKYLSVLTPNCCTNAERVPSICPRSAGKLQLQVSYRPLLSGDTTADTWGTGLIEGRSQKQHRHTGMDLFCCS